MAERDGYNSAITLPRDCWINLHSVDWNNNEIATAHSRETYTIFKLIIIS